MARRSTPNAAKAEAYFPVRVRVTVPPRGFGLLLDDMRRWLDEHAGREGWWMGSETRPGVADGALLYFADVIAAREFMQRFACSVLLLKGRESDRPD